MLAILLPAYNEEQSLPRLVKNLDSTIRERGFEYKIIACDDGSRDRTGEMLRHFAKTYPIHIIEHKYNRGLGETARDLFEAAAELCEPEDIIIRMDCDNTHKPEFIFRLTDKIQDGYDVVIASRFEPGGGQKGVNAYRAFISRCANLFMKVVFNIQGVREYSCGYRAYRARIIMKAIRFYGNSFIQLKGLGFTGTLEKLAKLQLIGAKFAEVPFVLRYDEKESASKMVTSITTFGYFTLALLYRWPFGGWRNQYRKRLKARETRPGSEDESRVALGNK